MPVYGSHGKALLDDHLESGKPLDEIQLNGIDLTGIDFSEKVFTELTVQKSLLDNAVFTKTTITNSLFEETNLRDTTFFNAVMSHTDIGSSILLRARMEKTRVFSCSFKRSLMQRLCIHRAMFSDCLFLNIEAMKTKSVETVFYGCDFRFDDTGGITGFQDSELLNCVFIGCSFEGFALTGVDLAGSIFLYCRFSVPDWEDVDTEGALFYVCQGLPDWKRTAPLLPHVLENKGTAEKLLAELRMST